MSFRAPPSRSGNLRREVAAAAARMMAEDGISDFGFAKRKAARQLGASDADALPTNAEIEAELRAGAWKVIAEARESGTAGIFRGDGEVRMGLIDEIVHRVDANQLLFEAPQKSQQVWFIRKFGPNVNLGNIPPDEVIPLETLRLGLRSDTLVDPTAGNQDGAGI